MRESFERAIVDNDYLVQQINRKFRSAQASYPHIRDFYFALIDLLNKGTKLEDLNAQVVQNTKFDYLTLQQDAMEVTSSDFNSQRKSAAFIREAITRTPKCKICGGYLHKNSITIDHIQRKEDGGIGSVDNAQLAHPYCNTTYKN